MLLFWTLVHMMGVTIFSHVLWNFDQRFCMRKDYKSQLRCSRANAPSLIDTKTLVWRLVERWSLRACLPADLSSWRERPASGGAWPYRFYSGITSDINISTDEERLRMGISKRRFSRGSWRLSHCSWRLSRVSWRLSQQGVGIELPGQLKMCHWPSSMCGNNAIRTKKANIIWISKHKKGLSWLPVCL